MCRPTRLAVERHQPDSATSPCRNTRASGQPAEAEGIEPPTRCRAARFERVSSTNRTTSNGLPAFPVWGPLARPAETRGFEPPTGVDPVHAFHACAISRSATSPRSVAVPAQRVRDSNPRTSSLVDRFQGGSVQPLRQPSKVGAVLRTPGGTRTHNIRFKRPFLYAIEVRGLGECSMTWADSNRRPSPCTSKVTGVCTAVRQPARHRLSRMVRCEGTVSTALARHELSPFGV